MKYFLTLNEIEATAPLQKFNERLFNQKSPSKMINEGLIVNRKGKIPSITDI